MSGCGKDCDCKELFARFAKGVEGKIEAGRLMITGNDLCGYATEQGHLLCELDMMGIKGFLDLLYSLESEVFTGDDIRREFHVVKLFYDYLREAGCVKTNPAEELRAAAIRQLLGRMEEKGYTRVDLPEKGETGEEGGEVK